MELISGAIARLVVGAVVGLCVGMTSIGGGILMIPMLTAVFGLSPAIAVGTATVYTFLTKIFATYRHIRLHTVDYRIATVFIAGAVPGSALASWFINSQTQGEEKEEFQEQLRAFIVVVMLFSEAILIITYLRPQSGGPGNSSGPSSPSGPLTSVDTDTDIETVPPTTKLPLKTAAALLAGGSVGGAGGVVVTGADTRETISELDTALAPILSDLAEPSTANLRPSLRKLVIGLFIAMFVGGMVGATAIGAGIIAIPTLLIFFNISPSQAVGTCIFIGLVITLVSSIVYSHGGSVDMFTGIMTSIGSVIGVYYGSLWSVRVSERHLQATLIVVILGSAIVMVYS